MASEAKLHSDSDRGREQFLSKIKLLKKKKFTWVLVKFQGLGISGIKVHRITRIHNRILRTRFDDKLDLILDRDDISELTQYVQMNTWGDEFFFLFVFFPKSVWYQMLQSDLF